MRRLHRLGRDQRDGPNASCLAAPGQARAHGNVQLHTAEGRRAEVAELKFVHQKHVHPELADFENGSHYFGLADLGIASLTSQAPRSST